MRDLRVLVAEDEPIAREHLVHCLRSAGGVTIVAECEEGRSALRGLEELRPDVAFLDIQMPLLDGLRVARASLAGGGTTAIVFTTAYEEHALPAFAVEAADYVMKPFDAGRIAESLARVRRRWSRPEPAGVPGAERLMLRSGGKVRVVDAAEVVCVAAEGDYCVFTLGGETLMVREPLKDLEPRLVTLGFVRIHRRVLINLAHLVEIRPWRHGDYEFALSDGSVFQSGPTYREAVQQLLGRRGP